MAFFISFSPMRDDSQMEASVDGDSLAINGQTFDFSPLPEGALLPLEAIESPWFAGKGVERIDGVLHVKLRLPHDASPPPEVAFPDPVSVAGGNVPIPGVEK